MFRGRNEGAMVRRELEHHTAQCEFKYAYVMVEPRCNHDHYIQSSVALGIIESYL